MSKTKPEWYKSAYNKLYSFLRTKHPEILAEYRDYLQKIKKRIENSYLVLEEGLER